MLGAGHDVGPAIAVQVGDDYLVGAPPVVLQEMIAPFAFGIAEVFEPSDPAGSSPGSSRHVEIAVAIQIAGDGLESVVEVRTDDMFPPVSPCRPPVVFIPDDLVVTAGL